MVNLTENQRLALENMEKFIGVRSNRTNFQSYKDFQDYFDKVKAKCQKKKKLLEDIDSGKITQEELRQKRKAKKENYYANENSLRQYALDYINRYFPSKNQLKDQLYKKSKNRDIIDKVFSEIEKNIDEDKMINSLVSQLKERGKNIGYISQKLYNKKYDGELIKKYLDELKNGGSLLNEQRLEEDIKRLQNEGKSKNAIFMRFFERGEDRVVLNKILDRIFDNEIDKENISKYIEEFRNKGLDTKKIIGKLLSKGFKYGDIKTNL